MRRNQLFVFVFALVGLACTLTGFRAPWVEASPVQEPKLFQPEDLDPVEQPYPSYRVPGRLGIVSPDGVTRSPAVWVFPNEHQECLCILSAGAEMVCRCQGKVPKWGECREAAPEYWGSGEFRG